MFSLLNLDLNTSYYYCYFWQHLRCWCLKVICMVFVFCFLSLLKGKWNACPWTQCLFFNLSILDTCFLLTELFMLTVCLIIFHCILSIIRILYIIFLINCGLCVSKGLCNLLWKPIYKQRYYYHYVSSASVFTNSRRLNVSVCYLMLGGRRELGLLELFQQN